MCVKERKRESKRVVYMFVYVRVCVRVQVCACTVHCRGQRTASGVNCQSSDASHLFVSPGLSLASNLAEPAKLAGQ